MLSGIDQRQHEPADEADRAGMGITVRDGSLSPSPAPTTRPLVRVDTSRRLLHTLRFSDESTPTRRRKPHGVLGAEVWVALAAPHDPPPLLTFAGENPAGAFRFLSVNARHAANRLHDRRSE